MHTTTVIASRVSASRAAIFGTVVARAGAALTTLIATLIVGFGLFTAPPARAATPRADVEARLDKGPNGPSPTALAEIARDAPRLLIQIAGDRAAALPLRGRALGALAYARTPEAHDFLENFIIRNLPSSDRGDRQLLRKAAVSLGWQAGGRSVEVLALLLEHADPEVRLDAALALGLTRARAAEKPLRARLERETDAAVRAQLEGQLRAIGAAPNDGVKPAP